MFPTTGGYSEMSKTETWEGQQVLTPMPQPGHLEEPDMVRCVIGRIWVNNFALKNKITNLKSQNQKAKIQT